MKKAQNINDQKWLLDVAQKMARHTALVDKLFLNTQLRRQFAK